MMKTPIISFVKEYNEKKGIRMHMPGHKGKAQLGVEALDITEIDGADELYFSDGIIKESEANASALFGAHTFYSAEGSSLAIRAMLFLAMTHKKIEGRPRALAARNVHKTFITAAALLDFDVEWMYAKESNTYHSCKITAIEVEESLASMNPKPFAVYVTSPDYLGNILDIESIAKVCKKYDVPLLVDNAHGAYLKLLNPSQHPIDLGADMTSDSAHKTLPALTGAAYLQMNTSSDSYFAIHAKEALSLFGSTSPSYLILESLDQVNLYISEHKEDYITFSSYLKEYRKTLEDFGYTLLGNEAMKLVIDAKAYGYSGHELAKILLNDNISVEFHDADYIVLMPTPLNSVEELEHVKQVLFTIPKRERKKEVLFPIERKEQILTIKEATLSKKRRVPVEAAIGSILADTAVTCPPAVPIVISGERITQRDVEMFQYYGILDCSIVDER